MASTVTKLSLSRGPKYQTAFDSKSHQLVDVVDVMLTGTDEHVALELVTKAKKVVCCLESYQK